MGWAKRDVEERKACVEEVRGVLMFTMGVDGGSHVEMYIVGLTSGDPGPYN